MKSGNYSLQLPSEDVDLDISQSTSSDLELSSCSATTNSDVVCIQIPLNEYPFVNRLKLK